MNERYNQPTAHMLQPTKGWSSMAHLDFVAPMASSVEKNGRGANAGTVMHLNASGRLETGLEPQSVGLFLFYKQFDEDTLNNPMTADGVKLTSVSMNSFGGYNSERGTRGYDINSTGTGWDDYRNGGASNWGPFARNASTDAINSYAYTEAESAHTTYPALCGMELASTECAWVRGASQTTNHIDTWGAGSSTMGEYKPNTFLTSPTSRAARSAGGYVADPGIYGDKDQQEMGGFLQPGVPYLDPICGVVSRGAEVNEHGYRQIYFWAVWLPALTTGAKPGDSATLKTGVSATAGTVVWAS